MNKKLILSLYKFLKKYLGKVNEDLILASLLYKAYMDIYVLKTGWSLPLKGDEVELIIRSQIQALREFIRKTLKEVSKMEKGDV